MFRATVLSIVLTLMAGPSASILCKAWCDPADAAAQGCHHRDASTSPALTGTDDCDNPVFTRAVLVKEDVRRSVSSPDTRQALIVPRYQYFASASGTHIWDEPGRGSPLAQPPLVTALRI
ncbi:MAG TPA: hypothetical protein VHI98_29730 [Vicinamibacterales bacterium]|nr:hypothetical protein [Vicinamibacterales bacterium]